MVAFALAAVRMAASGQCTHRRVSNRYARDNRRVRGYFVECQIECCLGDFPKRISNHGIPSNSRIPIQESQRIQESQDFLENLCLELEKILSANFENGTKFRIMQEKLANKYFRYLRSITIAVFVCKILSELYHSVYFGPPQLFCTQVV